MGRSLDVSMPFPPRSCTKSSDSAHPGIFLCGHGNVQRRWDVWVKQLDLVEFSTEEETSPLPQIKGRHFPSHESTFTLRREGKPVRHIYLGWCLLWCCYSWRISRLTATELHGRGLKKLKDELNIIPCIHKYFVFGPVISFFFNLCLSNQVEKSCHFCLSHF